MDTLRLSPVAPLDELFPAIAQVVDVPFEHVRVVSPAEPGFDPPISLPRRTDLRIRHLRSVLANC